MAGETYGLTEDNFLRELHHLLWMKPFKNRGKQDRGLSCRDHAAVVGVVARRLGAAVARIHGKMATITGEEIPRSLILTEPHTWLSLDSKAPCDLSFRVTRKESGGSVWQTRCIWNGEALDEVALPLGVASSEDEFADHIKSLHNNGVNRAVIYRPVAFVALKKDDRSVFEELSSPLKDEIRFCTGEDVAVYLGMTDFLVQKARGSRDSLVSLEQESAWQTLLSRSKQNNGEK
jgi:hypothetical protein